MSPLSLKRDKMGTLGTFIGHLRHYSWEVGNRTFPGEMAHKGLKGLSTTGHNPTNGIKQGQKAWGRSIKVAEYMTGLPKRELMKQKLHKAVELARKRLQVEPTERNTEYK